MFKIMMRCNLITYGSKGIWKIFSIFIFFIFENWNDVSYLFIKQEKNIYMVYHFFLLIIASLIFKHSNRLFFLIISYINKKKILHINSLHIIIT